MKHRTFNGRTTTTAPSHYKGLFNICHPDLLEERLGEKMFLRVLDNLKPQSSDWYWVKINGLEVKVWEHK